MTESFEPFRPLVFSIAYRMLGSVAEAEDVVAGGAAALPPRPRPARRSTRPKAYLDGDRDAAVRSTTCGRRACAARPMSAPWLPEPLVDESADAARAAEVADSLSMAFLVLLERLAPSSARCSCCARSSTTTTPRSPTIVGKSEDNCRQILVRARRRVDAERPRFEASRRERDALAERFFAAAREGDLDGLVGMLAADATFTGDGGGKASRVPAADRRPRPRRQARRRHLPQGHRLRRQLRARADQRPTRVLVRDPAGGLINTLVLDVADGLVIGVRSVINPDKLGHLGPVSDAARKKPR